MKINSESFLSLVKVNGKACLLIINIRATSSIIRSEWSISYRSDVTDKKCFATDSISRAVLMHDEADVVITLSWKIMKVTEFVALISYEFIFILDLMGAHKLVKYGGECDKVRKKNHTLVSKYWMPWINSLSNQTRFNRGETNTTWKVMVKPERMLGNWMKIEPSI